MSGRLLVAVCDFEEASPPLVAIGAEGPVTATAGLWADQGTSYVTCTFPDVVRSRTDAINVGAF